MKYKLLIIPFLSFTILLSSCTHKVPSDTQAFATDTYDAVNTKETKSLEKTPDAGQEYIDSFIFIGESTTYHLKSRGVLSGGKNTTQIWAPENGTVNLDITTKDIKIVYPQTNEAMTFGQAAKKLKPKRIMLTFGLNGAVTKIKKGKNYFHSCYLSLINDILQSSPNTEIILQSCFPIAENMDMSNYTVDAHTLADYIKIINSWSEELAINEGFGYINTWEALANDDGFLYPEYDASDGYHLNTEAYLKILEYIRTHAYEKNN